LKRSDATLYPDAIRETSRRQELGDMRAVGERVPDNVWMIPRVVGNSPERAEWMPTQFPIKLMERIISFSVSSDEWYVDLFGGSGSSLHAGNNLKRTKIGVVEIDDFSCEKISERTKAPIKIIEDGFEFPKDY